MGLATFIGGVHPFEGKELSMDKPVTVLKPTSGEMVYPLSQHIGAPAKPLVQVGDEVLVRILSVRRESPEDLSIRADIKSTSENTDRDNLQKCRIQGKYAGKVTDVHKGVVYVRLSNGVNAVAHSCYDYRMPGKKDDVSFAVTRLDMERGVAVGIITRIIRQNL